jgi:hypothetical protein
MYRFFGICKFNDAVPIGITQSKQLCFRKPARSEYKLKIEIHYLYIKNNSHYVDKCNFVHEHTLFLGTFKY